ncbi:hypothetical protein L1887_04609 [Cichorium endivia]|nr:hypothetical protein L1887_04609 [Cichorium endivia]
MKECQSRSDCFKSTDLIHRLLQFLCVSRMCISRSTKTGFILLAIFGMLTGSDEINQNYDSHRLISPTFQLSLPLGSTSYSYEGLILSVRGHGRPYVVILESGKDILIFQGDHIMLL